MNENQEREYVLEREIEELKAKLDTVTRERQAVDDASEKWKQAYFELIRAIGSSPSSSRHPVPIAKALVVARDEALAKLAARDTALAEAQKRLQLAEAVIAALVSVLCVPIYKGRECFFGYDSGFELGHAPAESIDNLNAAYAAWKASHA